MPAAVPHGEALRYYSKETDVRIVFTAGGI